MRRQPLLLHRPPTHLAGHLATDARAALLRDLQKTRASVCKGRQAAARRDGNKRTQATLKPALSRRPARTPSWPSARRSRGRRVSTEAAKVRRGGRSSCELAHFGALAFLAGAFSPLDGIVGGTVWKRPGGVWRTVWRGSYVGRVFQGTGSVALLAFVLPIDRLCRVCARV